MNEGNGKVIYDGEHSHQVDENEATVRKVKTRARKELRKFLQDIGKTLQLSPLCQLQQKYADIYVRGERLYRERQSVFKIFALVTDCNHLQLLSSQLAHKNQRRT